MPGAVGKTFLDTWCSLGPGEQQVAGRVVQKPDTEAEVLDYCKTDMAVAWSVLGEHCSSEERPFGSNAEAYSHLRSLERLAVHTHFEYSFDYWIPGSWRLEAVAARKEGGWEDIETLQYYRLQMTRS